MVNKNTDSPKRPRLDTMAIKLNLEEGAAQENKIDSITKMMYWISNAKIELKMKLAECK